MGMHRKAVIRLLRRAPHGRDSGLPKRQRGPPSSNRTWLRARRSTLTV
jgi:hypothetical protein